MTKWDGLLPISGPGSRPRNGVATGWAWRACQGAQVRRAAKRARATLQLRAQQCVRQGPGVRETWARMFGVATRFLMS